MPSSKDVYFGVHTLRSGMECNFPPHTGKRGIKVYCITNGNVQFTNGLYLITVDGAKPEEMGNSPGESFNSTKAKGLIEWSSPCDHQQGFRQLENVLDQFSFMVHFSSHLEALPPSTE